MLRAACTLLAIATAATAAASPREGPVAVADADPLLQASAPPVYPHYLLFPGTNIAGALPSSSTYPFLELPFNDP